VIEVDEDVLYARVIKEHAKNYKKFQRLIEGHGLRMAEHATSEFRVLLIECRSCVSQISNALFIQTLNSRIWIGVWVIQFVENKGGMKE
jgi:hypothetical protein